MLLRILPILPVKVLHTFWHHRPCRLCEFDIHHLLLAARFRVGEDAEQTLLRGTGCGARLLLLQGRNNCVFLHCVLLSLLAPYGQRPLSIFKHSRYFLHGGGRGCIFPSLFQPCILSTLPTGLPTPGICQVSKCSPLGWNIFSQACLSLCHHRNVGSLSHLPLVDQVEAGDSIVAREPRHSRRWQRRLLCWSNVCL